MADNDNNVPEQLVKTAPERDKLEKEKAKLATEIGIWGKFEPVENWQDTEQYKRMNAIDQRLSEIING